MSSAKLREIESKDREICFLAYEAFDEVGLFILTVHTTHVALLNFNFNFFLYYLCSLLKQDLICCYV